jgi:peptide chain release factor 2
MQQKSRLEKPLAAFRAISGRLDDAQAALDLAVEADDAELGAEAKKESRALAHDLERMELQTLLGGEEDSASAIVEVNAGAGGTDAQDWAEMLLRMYGRWAEAEGYKTTLMDRVDGEEAGIKSATLAVEGEYAFGYMKSEIGVHRLVRISPFDAQARRQTAFAAVYVWPDVDEDVDVEINEKDLRVDRFRSSGAGGQSVNTTDSAIRVTHLPTNIVVQCQNERSQHKNLAMAMKVLRARLYEHYETQRQAEAEAKAAPKRKIEWGSQIRSYVLAPYRLVKDLRTEHETGNVDAVLDGELRPFMEAWLAKEAGRGADG